MGHRFKQKSNSQNYWHRNANKKITPNPLIESNWRSSGGKERKGGIKDGGDKHGGGG